MANGEITVGKGALQQITGAIDASMTDALTKAGRSDLAGQFKLASDNYGQTLKAFEEGAIGRLAEKNPDAVASALLNKSSVFNVNTLRQTIGAKNMPVVERSLWEQLVNKSIDPDGQLNGKRLAADFKRLGPDVPQAIWGSKPGMMGKVSDFINTVGKYQDAFKQAGETSDDLHNLQTKQLGQFAEKANKARLIGGKVGVAAASAMADPLLHFLPGGIILHLAPSLGGVYIGYKVLSNPVVLDNLTTLMRAGITKGARFSSQNQAAIGKIMMVLNSTHASQQGN